MVVLLFFLSNDLFFFHLLGNFLYVVCCILWETVADDVILDFLCAYLAHHIVCASNCRIIYHSIMLILPFQCKDTPKLCSLSAFSIKNNISMII